MALWGEMSGRVIPRTSCVTRSQELLLTEQFYRWEKRGRGWDVWDYAVELEPPFEPFVFHYVERRRVIDAARSPGLLTSLMGRFKSRPPLSIVPAETVIPTFGMVSPSPSPQAGAFVEMTTVLAPDEKVGKDQAEQLVLALRYAAHPLSFEVIGLADAVRIQFVGSEDDRQQLHQQLEAYFPDAIVHEEQGFLQKCWSDGKPGVVVDFGLSQEFMLPLRSFRGFDTDPLIGVVGALADIRKDEIGVLQVIFHPARHSWTDSILRAVTDWEGKAFFANAPELVQAAKQKISRPFFATIIRAAAQSPRSDRAWQIVKALGGALGQFADPSGNELIPLTNDDYAEEAHAEDLLLRQSRRTGMLLNSDELISLVHPPSASVRSARLEREERKSKAAPASVVGHRLILGENIHNAKTVQVSLSPEQRVRHMYVVGASGTGKSTLLLNLILQDIHNGEGIGVLDPHGDLIDEILGRIPEHRHNDVVVFDPGDEEFPVAFNILHAHSDLEKNILASDLVSVFRRLSTSWGDQMTSVLGNAILAFLESSEGGTLADLRRFLIEPEFRKSFLRTVKDENVVYYWQKEFPLLTGKPQAPLLTRLDTFLRPKLIRYVVAQKQNRLDFPSIMNDGKIFLAKLSQGMIGEENAYLLGTFLVSKLHQTAIARQSLAESARKNFYLYIDEFHNFITPSMASILSGARKYRLGLILAHQDLQQLWSKDAEVGHAVISNPCTRVCFRVGDFDAHKLKEGFSFFEAKDLQSLGVGEAIARIERADHDFNLKTPPLPEIGAGEGASNRDKIMALSRQRYGRKRAEVEQDLRMAVGPVEAPPPETKAPKPTKTVEMAVEPPPIVKPVTPPPPIHVPAPPTPGRGGRQHKYLQELVKRLAEDQGYKATIEQEILDGVGSVDVSLEKDDQKIACEISVSTSAEHELNNVQKCLAAGYTSVVMLGMDSKVLKKVRTTVVAALDPASLDKVRFCTPEEFLGYLKETATSTPIAGQSVKGYKVKIKYRNVEEQDGKAKKQAVSQVILQALKRLRDGK